MAITCRYCRGSLEHELDEDVLRNLGVCTRCTEEERERLADLEDDDRDRPPRGPSMMTPTWITELSYEERCNLDNGIHPLCHRQRELGRWGQTFEAAIRILGIQLADEPSQATKDLVEQLGARLALLDDQASQVDARLAEWRAWRPENRDCIHRVPGGCESCHAKRARPLILRPTREDLA